MIFDLLRSLYHRTDNAVGSKRYLYHNLPKMTLNNGDVNRFKELDREADEQLKLTQEALQCLTSARQKTAASDSLYYQAASMFAEAKKFRELAAIASQTHVHRIDTELSIAAYEMKSLLAADDQQEQIAKLAYRDRVKSLRAGAPGLTEEDSDE